VSPPREARGRTSDGSLTAMALNNEKKQSRVTKDEYDLTKRRTPDDVRASKSDRTGDRTLPEEVATLATTVLASYI
jgi:hypothetical protein